MTLISTASGRKFDITAPDPTAVDIHDVAHALSQLCRYGGHTSYFYSVAQHSVIVSNMVSDEHALWGLLHDAAEAYLVDLPTPFKVLMPEYVVYETRVLGAVAEAFGLSMPIPEAVMREDLRVLMTEWLNLMPGPIEDLNIEAKPYRNLGIIPWPPVRARQEFMHRFEALWVDKFSRRERKV